MSGTKDLIKFYFKSIENNSCIFGSRFSYGGTTNNYPKLKYVLNRIFNNLVRAIFQINYNDFTNALNKVITNGVNRSIYNIGNTDEISIMTLLKNKETRKDVVDWISSFKNEDIHSEPVLSFENIIDVVALSTYNPE